MCLNEYRKAERVLNEETLDELIRQVLPAPRDTTAVCVRFGACRIRVRCSRPEMAGELAAYFGAFIEEAPAGVEIEISAVEGDPPSISTPLEDKQPDPGKTRIKEAWADIRGGRIVRKKLTGMVFLFSRERHVAVGPCMRNMNQVINFINNRYLQWLLDRGGLLGHAAGVVINGQGLAMAGFSGMGKSTLALRLMSRGATFLSNDRIVALREPGGVVMHGVAKLPRVNPGTLLANEDLRQVMEATDREEFEQLSEDELWELEHKYDVEIDRCFGEGRFVLEAPMRALAILNWHRDGRELQFRRVSLDERRELLPAFMKETGLFYLAGDDPGRTAPSPGAYAELLRGCEVYELSGGVDFDEAAARCEAVLNRTESKIET